MIKENKECDCYYPVVLRKRLNTFYDLAYLSHIAGAPMFHIVHPKFKSHIYYCYTHMSAEMVVISSFESEEEYARHISFSKDAKLILNTKHTFGSMTIIYDYEDPFWTLFWEQQEIEEDKD